MVVTQLSAQHVMPCPPVPCNKGYRDCTTYMFLCHSRQGRSIKQPVSGRLILQRYAPNMTTPVHIPCSNAHTKLLRRSKFTPSITDSFFERYRSYIVWIQYRESECDHWNGNGEWIVGLGPYQIRLLFLGRLLPSVPALRRRHC